MEFVHHTVYCFSFNFYSLSGNLLVIPALKYKNGKKSFSPKFFHKENLPYVSMKVEQKNAAKE